MDPEKESSKGFEGILFDQSKKVIKHFLRGNRGMKERSSEQEESLSQLSNLKEKSTGRDDGERSSEQEEMGSQTSDKSVCSETPSFFPAGCSW
jgi:hypothetical protein